MPATVGDLRRMRRDLDSAAEVLMSADDVLVVTHIDADGISAGAIADITLERLGKKHEVRFEKKISEETVDLINGSSSKAVWICDLGSGYLSEFERDWIVVTDHHVPDPRWRRSQTVLDSFSNITHINPWAYGMDGSYEICGAGMTYILSKTLDPANTDLAFLAIVGAVGDFQDSGASALVSMNRAIVADAEAAGMLKVDMDLRFFGRETRAVNQYLQFSSDPQIPGLSDNATACLQFLDRMGIRGKDGGRWRTWSGLSNDERRRATDAILSMLPEDQRGRAFGEMYTFPHEPEGTGLRDAKEFATILNSCGRYDNAITGLRICRGNMSAMSDAERNRAEHRKHISSAMSYIRDNHLLRERKFVQWFDAGSEIKETVVGIVAGMVLGSGECSRNIPIVAFADSDDGVKVSARANRSLVDRGLDLSKVMKIAAELVGGYGGGHTIAAGATIPPGRKDEFLDIVEDIVSSQVERRSAQDT